MRSVPSGLISAPIISDAAMQRGGGGNRIFALSYVRSPDQRLKARGLLPMGMIVEAQEHSWSVTAGRLHCVEVEHTTFVFKCGYFVVPM